MKTKEIGVDTVLVNLLDWDKINKKLTEKINDGTDYHIGLKWGMIQEPRPCLITDECVVWTPKDKDERSIELGIYEDDKPLPDGGFTISIVPKYTINVSLSDLEDYLADETKTLQEYMGSRYGYKARIRGNTASLINWLVCK